MVDEGLGDEFGVGFETDDDGSSESDDEDFVPEYSVSTERHCLQCELDYCADCFVETHAKTNPRMRFHKFQVIREVHAKVKEQFEWP